MTTSYVNNESFSYTPNDPVQYGPPAYSDIFTVHGSTTLDGFQDVVLCDSVSPIVVIVPNINMKYYKIKNINSGSVTLSGSNIEGSSTANLVQNQVMNLVCSGSKYYILDVYP